jgi:hypothetical protein
MFTPVVGLWPRGGFSYWSAEAETNPPVGPSQRFEANQFAFNLEAMLVLSPVPHAGFLLGPTLDFPITGGGEIDNAALDTDIDDLRITTLGFQVGVMAWF